MTITAASATMVSWANQWDAAITSAVLSGINGDQAHTYDPGKHLSRSDNIAKWGSSCWPVAHPKDKLGPSDKACAIDMNMNRADQNLVHNRFIAVYKNRNEDPRAQYVFAFNGWNGVGAPMRYNLVNGATAVTDDSHTWHEHVETFYGYVNDSKMVDAMMSIIKGETMAAYIGRTVKSMASIFDETIGGTGDHPGRTFRQSVWDQTQQRAWGISPIGTRGLERVPQPGSPYRALEEIYPLRKELTETRAQVAAIAAEQGVTKAQLQVLEAKIDQLVKLVTPAVPPK